MSTPNQRGIHPAPSEVPDRAVFDESDLLAEILAAEADFARQFPG